MRHHIHSLLVKHFLDSSVMNDDVEITRPRHWYYNVSNLSLRCRGYIIRSDVLHRLNCLIVNNCLRMKIDIFRLDNSVISALSRDSHTTATRHAIWC